MEILDVKATVEKEWEKLENLSNDQSEEQKRRSFWKHKKRTEQSSLLRWWTSVISKMRSCKRSTKRTKAGSCSEVTLSKTIQAPTQYSQNKVCLHLKWRPHKQWMSLQGYHIVCTTSNRRNIRSHPSQDGGRFRIIETSCIRNMWPKLWANIEDPVVPMGNRGTKTRQCQKFERNSFYRTSWRRISRHHRECEKKIRETYGGCHALQKKASGHLLTGYRSVQHHKRQCIWKYSKEKIQLYFGSSWIHKTKNGVFNDERSWRSHCRQRKNRCRIAIWCTSSFRCRKWWKFRMRRQQWIKNGKSSRRFQNGSWRKSEAGRRWKKKHRKTNTKSTLLHWWTSVIQRMRSWSRNPKGRVVLRGDIVKDDSRAFAVNTEQGSSVSQMTAVKVMVVIARLPDCDGQAADAISAHTQLKLEHAPRLLKIPKSECPDIWIRLPRHKWPKSWANIEDPVVPRQRNLCGHLLAGLLWERQFEEVLLELGWEKVPNR